MTSTIHVATHQSDPGRPCQHCGADSTLTIRVGDTTHYLCEACAGQDLARNAGHLTRAVALANHYRPEHAEPVASLPADSPQLRAALPAALRKLGYDQDDIAAALEDIRIGGV